MLANGLEEEDVLLLFVAVPVRFKPAKGLLLAGGDEAGTGAGAAPNDDDTVFFFAKPNLDLLLDGKKTNIL